jgi:AmiR/NasT family two-component response regulator
LLYEPVVAEDRAEVVRLRTEALVRDERLAELVREVEQLHAAREHQAVIEQAKGVIMSTMQCNADAAFAVLVAQSQTQNRKLRDIAAELVALQDRTARPCT